MTASFVDDRRASVVLCSYNRPEMLREALESLLAQQTEGLFTYEIVVVYGGVEEPTRRVIAELADTSPVPLRGVYEPRRGQVIARNRAIEEATGQWLAHFDDDQVAAPTWLKELLLTAFDKQARVVGGALFLKLPDGCERKLSWQCRRMLGESVNWNEVRPYTRKEGPGTGTVLIHRSVFEQLGRFDESFTLRGYDTDFYRRVREAGIEAWFTPHSVAWHVTPAERLTDHYFHETCLHNGWQFARRDFLEFGIARCTALLAARLGQAGLLHVPRWLAAQVAGGEEDRLTARCRLWRVEGYLRSVLFQTAPHLFAQRRFFRRFEFRAG